MEGPMGAGSNGRGEFQRHTVFRVDLDGIQSERVWIQDDERRHFALGLEGHHFSPSLSPESSILNDLERLLQSLSQRGTLRESKFVFGVRSDPFLANFSLAIRVLTLLARFQPGLTVIQTRSPLLVLAVPQLSALRNRVEVTVPIETHNERALLRYTPTLPKLSDRLSLIATLKQFRLPVTIQAGPLLPWGSWDGDGATFAEFLAQTEVASVYFSWICHRQDTWGHPKHSEVAAKLAADRKFHWLRPDTAEPLATHLEKIAPKLLVKPEKRYLHSRQLELFVA